MTCMNPFFKGFYYVIYTLLGWLVRLLYPLKVVGKENLVKGSFVLAPNHLEAIDPMYILLARGFGKKMLVMGKAELFNINPLLNFCWNIFGAFPVERGTGNRDTLDKAIEEVKKGRGLLIFPEGTRSKDGNLGKLKSGAFVVAQQAGADIVPCRISYSAGKPKLFRRINVVFGAPVSLQQLGLVGEYSPKALREAKHKYTEILTKLYDENIAVLGNVKKLN